MLKAILDSLEGVEPHFQSLYTERNGKYELTGIEGVKTQADIDRLQTALTKERNDHKTLKDRFATFGDRKPEDIISALDRIPELEAAAKGNLDEAKLNEIVEGRIKSRLAPVERQAQTLQQQLSEANASLEMLRTKDSLRIVTDAVRGAASKLKVVDSAVEDVTLLAERLFTIDETGAVVTKDNVGVTPGISADVWLTDMQAKRPHWWGPSQGGGAGGNRGGVSGVTNPWSKDAWNLTEQGRIYKENSGKAEQLAKAAGTTIGGPKPA